MRILIYTYTPGLARFLLHLAHVSRVWDMRASLTCFLVHQGWPTSSSFDSAGPCQPVCALLFITPHSPLVHIAVYTNVHIGHRLGLDAPFHAL